MQVQLRNRRTDRGQRRVRHGIVRAPEPSATDPASPAGANGSTVARSSRPSGEPLSGDEALYTCQCGYVFEAPVSTSVGCPHCGDTQAW